MKNRIMQSHFNSLVFWGICFTVSAGRPLGGDGPLYLAVCYIVAASVEQTVD